LEPPLLPPLGGQGVRLFLLVTLWLLVGGLEVLEMVVAAAQEDTEQEQHL
jgi:hypothetical protein